MGTQLLNVAQIDRVQRRVLLEPEPDSAKDDDDLHLLTTGSLSVDDFRTLKQWAADPTLVYFLGLSVPCSLEGPMQHVLRALATSESRGFVADPDHENYNQTRHVVEMLVSKGYVGSV